MDSPEYPIGDFLRDVLAILADENFNPRPHPELIPEPPYPKPEQPVLQPEKEETKMTKQTTADQTTTPESPETKKAHDEGFREGVRSTERLSGALEASKPFFKTAGWVMLGSLLAVAGYEGKGYLDKKKSHPTTPAA